MTKSVTRHWVGMNFRKMKLKGWEILVKGKLVPDGYEAVLNDFSFLKTNSKITVDLYILDSKLKVMPFPILKDITSSTNGTGVTHLQEGQCLALLLRGKGDGRSKISGYATGSIKKLK